MIGCVSDVSEGDRLTGVIYRGYILIYTEVTKNNIKGTAEVVKCRFYGGEKVKYCF